MLVIATDEAGYGPKLGPLVVAATAWQIPGDGARSLPGDPTPSFDLAQSFESLATPIDWEGTTVRIDDSKAVYQPGGGISALHAAVSASHHWCGIQGSRLEDVLPQIAPTDQQAIKDTPWLARLRPRNFLAEAQTLPFREVWGVTGIRQLATRVRIVTAARFNETCEAGANKADLLSEATLELVRQLAVRFGSSNDTIAVFCDRLGGRKYYAGVIQRAFDEQVVQVVSETPQRSLYRVPITGAPPMTIQFTVKGDSFAPVAFSSIHAKYLRERFMESLNDYFAERNQGPPLRATAGYPTDADRFLNQIRPIIEREEIERSALVRRR